MIEGGAIADGPRPQAVGREHRPGVAERARTFLLSNPLSTLRTATFSLPNPMGIAIPRLPLPDHFQVLTASLPRATADEALELEPPSARGPEIVRSGKGDRLMPTPRMTVRTWEPRKRLPGAPAPEASSVYEIDLELAVVDVEPFAETPDFLGAIARDINPVPPSGALTFRNPFSLWETTRFALLFAADGSFGAGAAFGRGARALTEE